MTEIASRPRTAAATATDPERSRRVAVSPRAVVEGLLLVVAAVVMLFPAVWMFLTSLKDLQDVYAGSVAFSPTAQNYRDVFVSNAAGGGASDLVRNFSNSIVVTGVATLLATIVGVPAAWAFSRFPIKAKKDQLFFILSTRFMPPVVVVIPLFIMYRSLQLYDTRVGLVLLYTAFNLPFTIWMMKGFIDEIPSEYEDAAMVDGFSRIQAFRKVSLPLLVPGILATAVFSLIFTWNEFTFAVFLTGSSARTVPPAIAGLLGGQSTPWGLVAAAAMVFAAPVLAFGFFVRTHLVAGMTFGAVRR